MITPTAVTVSLTLDEARQVARKFDGRTVIGKKLRRVLGEAKKVGEGKPTVRYALYSPARQEYVAEPPAIYTHNVREAWLFATEEAAANNKHTTEKVVEVRLLDR